MEDAGISLVLAFVNLTVPISHCDRDRIQH
jgi:hypothetical protein